MTAPVVAESARATLCAGASAATLLASNAWRVLERANLRFTSRINLADARARACALVAISGAAILAGAVLYKLASGRPWSSSLFMAYAMLLDAPGADASAGGEHPPLATFVLHLLFLVGLVVFAFVIGMVGEEVSTQVLILRNGRPQLSISNHLLILNWNKSGLAVIEQLVKVHNCKSIVVLAKQERTDLEEEIACLKLEKHGVYVGRDILVREGYPFVPDSLRLVCASDASIIILLHPEMVTSVKLAETRKMMAAAESGALCQAPQHTHIPRVRWVVLALKAATVAALTTLKHFHRQSLIVQVPNELSDMEHRVDMVQDLFAGRKAGGVAGPGSPSGGGGGPMSPGAGGQQQGGVRVVRLSEQTIVDRLIAQSSVQPGLCTIYESIFSRTQDTDVTFVDVGERHGPFVGVRRCFPTTITLGFLSSYDGSLHLNPDDGEMVVPGDKLVLLAPVRADTASQEQCAVSAQDEETLAAGEAAAEARVAQRRSAPVPGRNISVIGWVPEQTGELVAGFSEFSPPGTRLEPGFSEFIREQKGESLVTSVLGVEVPQRARARPQHPCVIVWVPGQTGELLAGLSEFSPPPGGTRVTVVVDRISEQLQESHARLQSSAKTGLAEGGAKCACRWDVVPFLDVASMSKRWSLGASDNGRSSAPSVPFPSGGAYAWPSRPGTNAPSSGGSSLTRRTGLSSPVGEEAEAVSPLTSAAETPVRTHTSPTRRTPTGDATCGGWGAGRGGGGGGGGGGASQWRAALASKALSRSAGRRSFTSAMSDDVFGAVILEEGGGGGEAEGHEEGGQGGEEEGRPDGPSPRGGHGEEGGREGRGAGDGKEDEEGGREEHEGGGGEGEHNEGGLRRQLGGAGGGRSVSETSVPASVSYDPPPGDAHGAASSATSDADAPSPPACALGKRTPPGLSRCASGAEPASRVDVNADTAAAAGLSRCASGAEPVNGANAGAAAALERTPPRLLHSPGGDTGNAAAAAQSSAAASAAGGTEGLAAASLGGGSAGLPPRSPQRARILHAHSDADLRLRGDNAGGGLGGLGGGAGGGGVDAARTSSVPYSDTASLGGGACVSVGGSAGVGGEASASGGGLPFAGVLRESKHRTQWRRKERANADVAFSVGNASFTFRVFRDPFSEAAMLAAGVQSADSVVLGTPAAGAFPYSDAQLLSALFLIQALCAQADHKVHVVAKVESTNMRKIARKFFDQLPNRRVTFELLLPEEISSAVLTQTAWKPNYIQLVQELLVSSEGMELYIVEFSRLGFFTGDRVQFQEVTEAARLLNWTALGYIKSQLPQPVLAPDARAWLVIEDADRLIIMAEEWS
ncbi:hypothetical protein FOA52_014828 [Chlamydomonas sp. UWO 241]|nr:hypothetical protein FOA52_014828 [Chlamydomonas sp. UWO 241]